MKKIKILYTINYLTNGGPTRVLQNIIKGLNRNIYDISVITIFDLNNENVKKDLLNNGVNIIEINIKKNILQFMLNILKIKNIIRSGNFDIIHVHGIIMSYVVSSMKINSKKLTTIHNNMYEDYKYAYGKYLGKIIEFFHYKWLSRMDLNICCSKTSYNIVSKRISNATFVRNGVDPIHNNFDKRKLRKSLNIDDKACVYIYGGVLTKRKRVDLLVENFNKCLKDDEYLIVVGSGPLETEIKKVNNNHIIFTGFKTNIMDYFDVSDVYVSFSSSEGFSISIIEALSSGLLCLVSDIDSHKECFNIANDYYIGEYFKDNDFNNKKKIIRKKISPDIKENLKKFQKQYLSSKSMASEYSSLYEKMVK